MKYAQTDTNGTPTAFYDKAVHGDKIPADAIQIDDADWQAHISGDLRQWDGSAWVPYVPPPPPLPDIQARAKAEVIAFADTIASRPDVAGAYPQSEKEGWATKLAAAEAHLAGSASQMQTDMLTTEANIVGITVDQLAQAIVAKAAWFSKVNATIAGMRQKAFAAIDAATDQAGIDAVLGQMKVDAEKALADLLASKP